jgi:hypothetical protein
MRTDYVKSQLNLRVICVGALSLILLWVPAMLVPSLVFQISYLGFLTIAYPVASIIIMLLFCYIRIVNGVPLSYGTGLFLLAACIAMYFIARNMLYALVENV